MWLLFRVLKVQKALSKRTKSNEYSAERDRSIQKTFKSLNLFSHPSSEAKHSDTSATKRYGPFAVSRSPDLKWVKENVIGKK